MDHAPKDICTVCTFLDHSACFPLKHFLFVIVLHYLNAASRAMTTTSNNQYHSTHPFAAVFAEYRDCPQHRSIVMKLCGIIQTITLRCPTALVWNWLGDGKTSLFICGSPLDILPCNPSSLPMLPSPQNQQIRAQIRVSENLIRQRGRAAEVNWSSDKCQQSQTGE